MARSSPSRSPVRGSWILLVLFSLFVPVLMVKKDNFKTCSQSGFCTRNRKFAESVEQHSSAQSSAYALDSKTLKYSKGQLTGTVQKWLHNGRDLVDLPLTISIYDSGVARVTLDEKRRQKGDIELRHDSKARKERYNEVEKWAIVGAQTPSTSAVLDTEGSSGTTKISYGPNNTFDVTISHEPFSVDFRRNGQLSARFNHLGYLNFEHWRPKVDKPDTSSSSESTETATPEPTEDESTWWDETFGGNTDSKPKGPESVGLDISFPGYKNVYGIPEHSGPLSLKETRGGEGAYDEPYRLYNSDVFEYEIDSPMTLYGSIPFMQAHKAGSSVGILWLNAAETWVDVVKKKTSSNPLSLGTSGNIDTQTHWFSESGLLDVFVFLADSPAKINSDYADLTGHTQLPQQFSIAYHQCRWNYVTDEDVKDVDRKFDKHNIPYDVIWLDIEYTDGKKYFTWDSMNFKDPIGMQKQLDEHDRKLVAIIDPHIKNTNDYPIVDQLKSKDLAVKNKKGEIYEGWCWPGSSHWVDCFNPAAIKWWISLFKYDNFYGEAKNMFLWNDMNEPSVFNGPETTMPKDNLHHGNWEHRDVHNLNGMTLINASFQALESRAKGELTRPFVLTRSFFVGSQRLGATWTGDNQAEWSHLEASIPMILNNGVAGFPNIGADVGGFFGNPSKELLTRWYQAGAFYPFFRGHAHIDTRRREPYLAGEPYTTIITQALRLRYQLLPAWYTAFHEASTTGAPVIRPNFFVHPEDEAGFEVDDQFFLGSSGLLVKPVTKEGADTQSVYFGDDEVYYDYFDYTAHKGQGTRQVSAPLDVIPLFMRGGHIIPRRDRPRRSSGLMHQDPFTLVVVRGNSGDAEGDLYFDDGMSYDYQQGAYIHRHFSFKTEDNTLRSENRATAGKKTATFAHATEVVKIEKLIVVGAPSSWASKKSVTVNSASGKVTLANLKYQAASNGKAAWAVVDNLNVPVGQDWSVSF